VSFPFEKMAGGRVRLTLDVLETARPKLRYQPERVRLSARKVPAGLEAGATVSGFARLMPPTGPVRPGGYDFSFQSYISRGSAPAVSFSPIPGGFRLRTRR